jgi:hypothetical protein
VLWNEPPSNSVDEPSACASNVPELSNTTARGEEADVAGGPGRGARVVDRPLNALLTGAGEVQGSIDVVAPVPAIDPPTQSRARRS